MYEYGRYKLDALLVSNPSRENRLCSVLCQNYMDGLPSLQGTPFLQPFNVVRVNRVYENNRSLTTC